MTPSLAFRLAAVAILTAPLSCKQRTAQPPVAAGPLPVQPAPSLPAPPPPTPACESLEEKCQALPETQLQVPGTGVWFRPPASWTYAKESNVSLALAPNALAVLALSSAANEESDSIVPVLERLFTRLEIGKVAPASLKPRLKSPDTVLPAEGAQLKLWEIDGKRNGVVPELKGKRGSLLLVVTTSNAQAIVGAAFVVKPEAEAEAPAIMTAVQSLSSK
jgi:hypothetical protein